MLSVIVASIYFYFSPISYASQEIINRTAPTLWDALIALFGGTAGIIGARKKTINNIVPGVAIATALMPPICTVGYGIASKNLSYATGAGYLFIIMRSHFNDLCWSQSTADAKSSKSRSRAKINQA